MSKLKKKREKTRKQEIANVKLKKFKKGIDKKLTLC